MLSLCFAVPNEDTNLTAVDLSSSIYAPLLGATEGYYTKDETDTFQSTYPLRGVTCCVRIICLLRGVVYSVGLAFSASAANIADVGRFLQLLARIVIV